MSPEKYSPHKISRPFWRKDDYESDTNKKNCNADDSQYNNDYFVKTFDKEQYYKEDNECKEYSSVVDKQ